MSATGIGLAAAAALVLSKALNVLSYRVLKGRVLRRRTWGLNICCGKTDGGGVNADIVPHARVPRFVQVGDVARLPFRDGQFDTVLCSHTVEHVDDPEAFQAELARVGREVWFVVPPLWDVSAALNILEHRWLFLTFRKEHRRLPRFVRLPFARAVQRRLGQRIHA
jgi:SAM-dependent methyltransferase